MALLGWFKVVPRLCCSNDDSSASTTVHLQARVFGIPLRPQDSGALAIVLMLPRLPRANRNDHDSVPMEALQGGYMVPANIGGNKDPVSVARICQLSAIYLHSCGYDDSSRMADATIAPEVCETYRGSSDTVSVARIHVLSQIFASCRRRTDRSELH